MDRGIVSILIPALLPQITTCVHAENLFAVTCVSDGDTISYGDCGIGMTGMETWHTYHNPHLSDSP